MTQRPPWSAFRAVLDERGFHPSRHLGQNFLLDENMVRAIVRDARIQPGDFVLEVGAGCGFLSLHLLDAGAELVCVEIDARLLAIARDLLAPHGEATFLECDALSGKHELAAEIEAALPEDRSWHLVSNLPYSISGPLLVVLASHRKAPETMTVLVQKEVGERIAARPASAAWGPLSVRLQLRYRPKIVRTVSPALFWPRPKVESALVRMEREGGIGDREALARVDRLVGELFSSRRQSLGRVLTRLTASRSRTLQALQDLGIDPSRRAETLDLPALLSLEERLNHDALPRPPDGG